MSNGDDQITRKSHIKRIYKDDDPNTNPDLWIDVERLDELRFVSHKQFPFQEKRWAFDWDSFNPDGTDADGNAIPKKRVVEPNDASIWIEVPIRRMVLVTLGKQFQYQAYKHYLTNDDSNQTRETHSRRIYHHDIDNALLDDNKNPPRDPKDYRNVLSTQDQKQFVDVEIIDKFWTNENESRDSHGNKKPSTWQEKKWLLDQTADPLLKDPLVSSDVPDPDFVFRENPSGGGGGEVTGSVIVDPPWRLDPLQNIVNVSWGGIPGILIQVSHDAEYSPNVYVNVIDGHAIIARSTTEFDPLPIDPDGADPNFYGITTSIAINLTKFVVGKTQIVISCPGQGPYGMVWTDSHPATDPVLGASWGYNGPGEPKAVYGDIYPVTHLYLGGVGHRGLSAPPDMGLYYWGVFPGTPFNWTVLEGRPLISIPGMAAPMIYDKKLEHLPTKWPKGAKPDSVTIIPADEFGDGFVCPNGDGVYNSHLTIEEGKTEPETPSFGHEWTYTLEKEWNKKAKPT